MIPLDLATALGLKIALTFAQPMNDPQYEAPDRSLICVDYVQNEVVWSEPIGFEVTSLRLCDDLIAACTFDHFGRNEQVRLCVEIAEGGQVSPRRFKARSREQPVEDFPPGWGDAEPTVHEGRGWQIRDFKFREKGPIRMREIDGILTVWSHDPVIRPGEVAIIGDMMIYLGYHGLRDSGVYAVRVGGDSLAWKLDLAATHGRFSPLEDMTLETIGNDVYVQANQYILQLDPETGDVLEELTFTELTGLPYRRSVASAFGNRVTMSGFEEKLAIAYPGRIIIYDLTRNAVVTHFKSSPINYPLVLLRDEVVYFMSPKDFELPMNNP